MALPSVPVYWGVKVSERSVADTCWQLTTLAPVIANEPVGVTSFVRSKREITGLWSDVVLP